MVQIDTIVLVIAIVLVNEALTHLFNWGFRAADDSNEATTGLIFLNIIKLALIIQTFNYLIDQTIHGKL